MLWHKGESSSKPGQSLASSCFMHGSCYWPLVAAIAFNCMHACAHGRWQPQPVVTDTVYSLHDSVLLSQNDEVTALAEKL
jgi:hypothetical protein